MRPRPLTYPGLLLLTALVAPRVALAGAGSGGQPPPPAAPAAPGAKAAPAPASGTPDDRAAQLYAEGNAFYDGGKYKEAEAKYQAAWDIQRSFDVAGNLGNVEMLIDQPRDAAEHLTYALQIFPLGGGSAKKQFLQTRLAEAKKRVGALQISVNIEGAEVFIDGKQVGKSPLATEVFVEPGEHVVEARLGSKTAHESILVAKGSSQPVALAIETGPNLPIVIAGGSAGVLGIASGVVFAILSNSKASDAEAEKAGSQERADLRDSQTTFGNISFWSFVGGGVALAGTAVYVLTNMSGAPKAEVTTGVRAAPMVVAKGGGLMIGGSF